MTDQEDDMTPADAGVDAESDEQIWKDLEQAERDVAASEPEDKPDSFDDDPEPAAQDAEPEPPKETPEEQRHRLEQQFKSSQGRLKTSLQTIEQLRRELAEAKKSSPDKQDDTPRREREKRLQDAVEEYGDVLAPVAEEIRDLRQELQNLSAIRESDRAAKQSRYNSLTQEEFSKFQAEHPDGMDFLKQNAAAFNAWIADQPKAHRDIFAANHEAIVDGESTAYLVSLFKEYQLKASGAPVTRQTERRRAQLAGAQSTRSTTRQATVSDMPPNTTDDQAIWDYWERKDREKAQRR